MKVKIILKSEAILIIRIKMNLRTLQSLYCYPYKL